MKCDRSCDENLFSVMAEILESTRHLRSQMVRHGNLLNKKYTAYFLVRKILFYIHFFYYTFAIIHLDFRGNGKHAVNPIFEAKHLTESKHTKNPGQSTNILSILGSGTRFRSADGDGRPPTRGVRRSILSS